MAKTLIVRNLPESLVRQLRIRAATNDRSAEEEHREILRQALSLPRDGPGFLELAAASREALKGKIKHSSESLIREDRDRP